MTGLSDGGSPEATPSRLSRRRLLTWGLGGAAAVVGAGAVGIELVSHGVLPGKSELDQLDGACSVSGGPIRFGPTGTAYPGSFQSAERGRAVDYQLIYPSGHRPGSMLPLVVVLHGYGETSAHSLSEMTLPQASGVVVAGRPLRPMALVAADGGGGYWHPHPGDNPMGMVVNELIPMCQAMGLGTSSQNIGVMGISMGGYGALLLAEKYPRTFAAAAAISPAVWTSYDESRRANQGAFTSTHDFAEYDVIAHASALAGTPVRVSSGASDPFHPGVEALVKVLPRGAVVDLSSGCHTAPFFGSQEPPSLAFLAEHLST